MPPNISGAKEGIESKNFGLFDNEYDLLRQHEIMHHEMQKRKQLHGEFKKANYFDNGTSVDQFGCVINKSRKKQQPLKQDSYSNRSQSHNLMDNASENNIR